MTLEFKYRHFSKSTFMRSALAFYLAKHKRFAKPCIVYATDNENVIKIFNDEYPHLLLTDRGAYGVVIKWCSCKERTWQEINEKVK